MEQSEPKVSEAKWRVRGCVATDGHSPESWIFSESIPLTRCLRIDPPHEGRGNKYKCAPYLSPCGRGRHGAKRTEG